MKRSHRSILVGCPGIVGLAVLGWGVYEVFYRACFAQIQQQQDWWIPAVSMATIIAGAVLSAYICLVACCSPKSDHDEQDRKQRADRHI